MLSSAGDCRIAHPFCACWVQELRLCLLWVGTLLSSACRKNHIRQTAGRHRFIVGSRPGKPMPLHKKRSVTLLDIVQGAKTQKFRPTVDLLAFSLKLHKKTDGRFIEHHLEAFHSGQAECGAELLVAKPGPQAQRFQDSEHL